MDHVAGASICELHLNKGWSLELGQLADTSYCHGDTWHKRLDKKPLRACEDVNLGQTSPV